MLSVKPHCLPKRGDSQRASLRLIIRIPNTPCAKSKHLRVIFLKPILTSFAAGGAQTVCQFIGGLFPIYWRSRANTASQHESSTRIALFAKDGLFHVFIARSASASESAATDARSTFLII